MASDIDLVIRHSKRLEQLLEQRFQAQGRGLHEKVTHVADRLDEKLVKNLRWIATMRNKVVHEDFSLDNPTQFEKSCERALEALQHATPRQTTSSARRSIHRRQQQQPESQPMLIALVVGILLLALYMVMK